MKKILLFLGLFTAACSTVSGYDTEFKNPVFNQPLRPLSSGTGYVYITPKSVDFRTPFDKNKIDTQGKCDLIENKQDRITLKCDFSWYDHKGNSDIKQYYFTFLSKGYFFDTHIKIEGLTYQIRDGQVDKISSKFYITPYK